MNKGFPVSSYKEANMCEGKEYWATYLPRGSSAFLGFVLNCDGSVKKHSEL